MECFAIYFKIDQFKLHLPGNNIPDNSTPSKSLSILQCELFLPLSWPQKIQQMGKAMDLE